MVIEKLKALPPDQQREVPDFLEFLLEKQGAKQPHESLHGLWADLGIEISEEDIADARREISNTFLRESFSGRSSGHVNGCLVSAQVAQPFSQSTAGYRSCFAIGMSEAKLPARQEGSKLTSRSSKW